MIKRLFCLLLVLALLGCSTGLTAFSEADPPVGEEVQQIINEEPTVNEPEQPASESAPEQPAADPAPQAPAAPTQEQQPAADSENETPADNVTAPEIDETPAADEMTPVESTAPNVEEPPAAEETHAAVETPEADDVTAAADATEEPAETAAPTDTPAPTEDPYKGMVDPSTNKDDYTKGVWLHVVHGGFTGTFRNADDPNVTQEYDVSNFASVWVDFTDGRKLPTELPTVKGLNGGTFQGWYTKAPTERQVSGGEGANSYFYYEITPNGDKIEPGTTSVSQGIQVLYAVFTYPAPQDQQQDQQRITFRYNWNGMHGYYSSALTHETTRSNGTFKAGDAIVSFVNMNNDLLGKYNELTKAGTSDWDALKAIWSKSEEKNNFDGYRFLGWSLTAQASPEEYIWSDTVIPNDAIFYAQWEKIEGADVSSGTQGREVGAESKVTALSLSAEKTTLDPTNANGQWWKSEKSEVATTSWLDDKDTFTTLTLTATPQNGDVTGVEWYVKVGDGEFKPLSDYDNSVFTCMKKGNQFILAAGANTADGQTVSVKAMVGEVESDSVTITFQHNMGMSLNDDGMPVSVCSVCGLEVDLPADEAPADDMGLLSDAAPAPTEDPYQGMRDPSTNADNYAKGVWLHVIHGGFTGTFVNTNDKEKYPEGYNIQNFSSVWVDFTDGTRQLPNTLPTVNGLNGGEFVGWYTGAPREEKVTEGSGTDGYFYYQITPNGTKIELGQKEVPSGTQVLYAVYQYAAPTENNQKRVTYRYNWNGMNGDYWSLIQETTRANDIFKASDAIVSSKNWNDALKADYENKGSDWGALKEIWTKGNPDNNFNGYHFLGWSLNDPTGKQVISEDTKIPNDAVFYAVWEKGDSSSATEGRSIYPEVGPVKEIYIAAQGSQTFYMDAGKTESVAVPVLVTPVGGTGEITWTVEVLREISNLGDYFMEPIVDTIPFTAETVDHELQKHKANFDARVSGLTLIITPHEGFTQGLLVSASCNGHTTPTKAAIVIKHTPSDAASVVTPATCTHHGEEEIVCVECGAVTETTEIPATGHTYEVKKTGVEDGVAVYTKTCISGDDTMTVKAGDANGDNSINALDTMMLLQNIVGERHYDIPNEAADVNHDGSVDALDTMIVLQYIVGERSNIE